VHRLLRGQQPLVITGRCDLMARTIRHPELLPYSH
jgi:hypothetical protein